MKTLSINLPVTSKLKERILKNIHQKGENIAVGGIIKYKDYYVLVKNQKPPFNRGWIFPAGGAEGDETAEQALKREIREETNLEVKVDKIQCVLMLSNIKKSRIIIYNCSVREGSVLPGDNIDAVGLFKKLPPDLDPICRKIF